MKFTILIPLFFAINFSSAQMIATTNPCDADLLSEFTQSKDGIEFHIQCFKKLDLRNETCQWIIAENNENIVPDESAKMLVVLYVTKDLSTSNFDAMRMLEDARYRRKYLRCIQAVYVSTHESNINGLHEKRKAIKALFREDLRLELD